MALAGRVPCVPWPLSRSFVLRAADACAVSRLQPWFNLVVRSLGRTLATGHPCLQSVPHSGNRTAGRSTPRAGPSLCCEVSPLQQRASVYPSVGSNHRLLTQCSVVRGRTTNHAAKDAADLKRGKFFAKLCQDIAIAVKLHGPDPESNPRLATAIAAAKKERVPKEKITRALDPGAAAEEIYTIEATAVGGSAALLIDTTIEPKQRGGLEAGDLRKFIIKNGGNIKEMGTLQYLFEEKFVVDILSESIADIDDIEELAINVGAEDVVEHSEGVTLVCDKAADTQQAVLTALEEAEIDYDEAGVRSMPITSFSLDESATAELSAFLDALTEHPSSQGSLPESSDAVRTTATMSKDRT